MIEIGQKLPLLSIKVIENGQIQQMDTNDFFQNKTVILFGVPGAFTPTCSNSHLPSFLKHYEEIKTKGVDSIVCMAVNDAHVLLSWAKATDSVDKITFIADGSAVMIKAMGLDWDGSDYGMGIRAKRFSMLVKNSIIQSLYVESSPGECMVTDAQTIMADL